MNENQARIGIDRSNRLQGEQMLRALQHPAARHTIQMLQILKKPLVKAIRRQIAEDIRVEPRPV